MTCTIDHDAENAIPVFLCVACNRQTIMTKENHQTIDMAICAAVELQGLEPAVSAR